MHLRVYLRNAHPGHCRIEFELNDGYMVCVAVARDGHHSRDLERSTDIAFRCHG